ncbi:unnamed protein product [Caretta caretta]
MRARCIPKPYAPNSSPHSAGTHGKRSAPSPHRSRGEEWWWGTGPYPIHPQYKKCVERCLDLVSSISPHEGKGGCSQLSPFVVKYETPLPPPPALWHPGDFTFQPVLASSPGWGLGKLGPGRLGPGANPRGWRRGLGRLDLCVAALCIPAAWCGEADARLLGVGG